LITQLVTKFKARQWVYDQSNMGLILFWWLDWSHAYCGNHLFVYSCGKSLFCIWPLSITHSFFCQVCVQAKVLKILLCVPVLKSILPHPVLDSIIDFHSTQCLSCMYNTHLVLPLP
jgi:hypothetical protein